jgi:hypothetical protein
MRSPILQTDSRLPEQINRAGCLFRSLVHLAEIEAKRLLTADDIKDIYLFLVKENHMKANCWVLNHESVIAAAQYHLGEPQRARYVYRDEADGSDFGNPTDGDYHIRHVRTMTGTGHFYVCDYSGVRVFDPYWPVPMVDYAIGIRGYRVG